jgi:hypothetical protein
MKRHPELLRIEHAGSRLNMSWLHAILELEEPAQDGSFDFANRPMSTAPNARRTEPRTSLSPNFS